MEEQYTASDEYREKLRALDQELTAAQPAKKRSWLPAIVGAAAVLLLGVLALWTLSAAGFFDVKTVQGPAGPRGLQGPPGPPGPAGTPGGSSIRIAEFGCNAASCSLACNDNERVLNVYALAPGGSFVFDDDRSVTFRPVRRPSSKIVLICIAG